MPDEWVVLREDIARALLGEGLRIPMKPAAQRFVEIDLERDSLADIEAKLEAMCKRLEDQGLMAADSGPSL
jgi:plasmid stability protein